MTFEPINVLGLFMSELSAKRERVEQILGELSELGLMLARDLAVTARAAETHEEKVALAAAFQKTSRAVRLTLALDFKLQRQAERDTADAAREAADAAAQARLQDSRILQAARAAAIEMTDPSPEENQTRRVKAVLNRLIWNEAEGDEDEYEVLLEDLDTRLWAIQDAPGFAETPIEVLAARLAADMRLSGELVITSAERIIPANNPTPALADTG